MPDYIRPDCGGLVTCLSCTELHAGQLPHGPAFVNHWYDPDWYRNDYLKQPKSDHNEERGTEDCADEEFETIGANEPLSFDLTDFTDARINDQSTAPSQQNLFA